MDVLVWKGDPGQREAVCLQELQDMACVEVWGIEEASAGSFNTAGLYGTSHQRRRSQQLPAFLLGKLFCSLVAASSIF